VDEAVVLLLSSFNWLLHTYYNIS